MTDTEKALEKLANEWKECPSIGGSKNVVNRPIYDMLRGFCKADAEFAGLLAATDRTLKQCLEQVHKEAQSGWSDYAVFSRAVAVYVPGAKIRVMMEIDMNGDIDAGVAFGKDAKATEKMYHDKVAASPKWEPKSVKKEKPTPPPKAEKSKPAAPPKKTAKVLPPLDTTKENKAEITGKPMRFNLLDML